MNKILLIFISISIKLFANGFASSLKITSISHEAIYSKQIMNITPKDLSLNSKSDNIQNLLEKALNEDRITYSQFNNISLYNNLAKGDFLLLKCLKEINCDIENFAKIMQKSELHQKIASKFPQISIGKLNQLVGITNENLMNKYFVSSGWNKIEGEVGINGIDGLFIKKNKEGVIKDVLIVESKYNKSGLQDTENGQQMTKKWILKKIENLKQKYPNDTNYEQIEKFVNNDIYRAMLWNLKIENEKLIFDLSKVNDKFGKIEKVNLVGGEKFKINQLNNSFIDVNKPENLFQQKIVNWYKEELNNIKL